MFTATQLWCHLVGDYVLQSSWMANGKTKRWIPAIAHSLVYFTPFFFVFQPSLLQASVMIGTHILIDRFRLARFVAFANHYISPPQEWKPWAECSGTGYYKDTPPWLATWLMIIVDNVIHLTINAIALTYL